MSCMTEYALNNKPSCMEVELSSLTRNGRMGTMSA